MAPHRWAMNTQLSQTLMLQTLSCSSESESFMPAALRSVDGGVRVVEADAHDVAGGGADEAEGEVGHVHGDPGGAGGVDKAEAGAAAFALWPQSWQAAQAGPAWPTSQALHARAAREAGAAQAAGAVARGVEATPLVGAACVFRASRTGRAEVK